MVCLFTHHIWSENIKMLKNIKDILGIGSKIIDQVVPNRNEANRMKAKLAELVENNQLTLAKLGVSSVVAEAQGESWLQRNWRPIAMINFLIILNIIVVASLFGKDFDPALLRGVLELLTMGIGGYVMLRGGEKIAKTVAEGMKAKHQNVNRSQQ